MKVTFPHLGPVYLTVSLAMKELGIPAVVPPPNTAETLKKGGAVSPEEMCLPFKFMAGNLIQAYEKGARRVIMPATMGPCRLGEYGELLKEVLSQSGYDMEWILMDTPKAIGLKEWIKRLQSAGRESDASLTDAASVLVRAVRLARALDKIEGQFKSAAGYATEPADCVRMLRNTRNRISKAENLNDAYSIIKKQERRLARLPIQEDKEPVTVLVAGEIYTSIESAANQNLEEHLMLLGCSVRRPVTISWWVKNTMLGSIPLMKRSKQNYLPYSIGGYAKETVEEISASGEDGVIKIMPAGCMPEIVAKAVSNVVAEDKGTKILHLVFDEMQANAGYETRVEAFVDMLERRKRVFLRN